MENKAAKKVVLVAVLNWGLGHATRCVPLIKALQQNGFTPILASDGLALHYLQAQFPAMQTYALSSYKIKYKGSSFLLNMLFQLPKIARAAAQEHQEIKRLVKLHNAVGIISDNRLGARSKKVPSGYITHQVNIKAGLLSAFAGWAHRFYINQFDVCLIPDIADEKQSLAGQLSHGFSLKKPVQYMGPLSRFSTLSEAQILEKKGLKSGKKLFTACIILSGPEPARTQWEREILQQVKELSADKFLLIRGSETKQPLEVPNNLKVLHLATAEEVLIAIKSAEVVVSRSGYSSLMDYVYLQNKALLVPTPGQSEQEYLARRHSKIFAVQNQTQFNLMEGIAEAKTKTGFEKNIDNSSAGWAMLFSLFEGK